MRIPSDAFEDEKSNAKGPQGALQRERNENDAQITLSILQKGPPSFHASLGLMPRRKGLSKRIKNGLRACIGKELRPASTQ